MDRTDPALRRQSREPQEGQSADRLTEGEAGKGLDPGELQRILKNRADYYVNVHNAEYLSGAIRGQLHADFH